MRDGISGPGPLKVGRRRDQRLQLLVRFADRIAAVSDCGRVTCDAAKMLGDVRRPIRDRIAQFSAAFVAVDREMEPIACGDIGFCSGAHLVTWDRLVDQRSGHQDSGSRVSKPSLVYRLNERL